MKNILLMTLLLVLSSNLGKAQELGNANYTQHTNPNQVNISTLRNVEPIVSRNSNNQLTIVVRGIYNEIDIRRVAYFSVTQLGEDVDDVNSKMNERIKNVEEKIKAIDSEVEFFVDMISFIPMYEYEVEKKVFSKRTYNEIPKGFELKKNLHFKYSDGRTFEKIMAICAESEIYDLIKVEYISKNYEAIHDSLRERAKAVYQKTLKYHEELYSMDFSKKRRYVNEGFNEVYPKDRYQSYTAFSTPNLKKKKRSVVQVAQKSTTVYYEPMKMVRKNFVINPEILEPTIQVVYELQVVMNLVDPVEPPKPIKPEPPKTIRKYYMITPQGDFKKVPIE